MRKFLYGFISGVLFLPALFIFYPWRDSEGCMRCREADLDIHSQSKAIELYYKKAGKFPSNEEGMEILVNKFLDELKSDPWGEKYFYSTLNFANKKCYVIWSFGSDRKPGGEKESEKDIFVFGENESCL